jgi:hypothetical protein
VSKKPVNISSPLEISIETEFEMGNVK